MTMSSHSMRALVTLLCTALATAACVRDGPEQAPAPPPPAGWPGELPDFSFTWTAEPGVDLTTDSAAIATRAYVESYFLAVITENADYLYPGFDEAVAPDQPGGAPGTRELRPRIGDSEPDIYIGTVRHHVLNITRSDLVVTLTGCAYTYGSAIRGPDGTYSAIVGDALAPGPGIYPMRIGLKAPQGTQPKLPPQQGPSKEQ